MSDPTPVVHMIRVTTPKMTFTAVTQPTMDPVEQFEADQLAKIPGGTLKRSHTFTPIEAALLVSVADDLDLDLSDVLAEADEIVELAGEAPKGTEEEATPTKSECGGDGCPGCQFCRSTSDSAPEEATA